MNQDWKIKQIDIFDILDQFENISKPLNKALIFLS
jgi:hypothetical protein